jgi:hypothetical protein
VRLPAREPYPDWVPATPWPYLRGLYNLLHAGWLTLALADYDAMAPALLDDLLVLAAKDAHYHRLAHDDRLVDPDAQVNALAGRATFLGALLGEE